MRNRKQEPVMFFLSAITALSLISYGIKFRFRERMKKLFREFKVKKTSVKVSQSTRIYRNEFFRYDQNDFILLLMIKK